MTKSELKKVNKGLCIRCGQSPCTNGTLQCDECKAKAIARQKDNYEKRKNIGVCLRCGEERSNNGTGLCDKCRTQQSSVLLDRKNKGMCANCGKKPNTKGTPYCDKCGERRTTRWKSLVIERREKGLCTKCGKPAVVGDVCESCWFKNISVSATGRYKNWCILKELLISQDFLCVYTGRKLTIGVNASLDHIIPSSKGGDNSIENLQWVDLSVNLMKRDMNHQEFLATIELVYERNLTKDK